MENSALLLGVPLVVIGAIGALMALGALLSSVGLPPWLLEPMGSQEPAGAAPGEAHPAPSVYLRAAAAMSLIEALELVIYYFGRLEDNLALSLLLVVTVIQFALIAMWYMHLRFDSGVFSQLLVGGLLLAAALFVVVLATLGSSLI